MGLVNHSKDFVFHRDFNKDYPIITHGKGVYLYDSTGKRYLDGSAGAIAANLGHGVNEIADAMAKQAKQVAFVHTLRFETEVLHELAKEIGFLTPDALNRVYFTSGGSEANESAIKLARQYHRDKGDKEKHIVIGRWQSYHGNTFGSLSAGGDIQRRKPYTPNLMKFEHVHSPYCHKCPYNQEYSQCKQKETLLCVDDIERLIKEVGPEFISSFICEPIIGSQQGAVVPPKGYLKQVRELCDKYDIVLIVDEVMTGFGRTGAHFAVEHFDVVPDIITFGKGVSAGYAPLAGMVVHNKIVDSIMEHSQGRFIHGYTYSGHPVSVAAGLASLQFYKKHHVLENCKAQGAYLFEKLTELKDKHNVMGQIRGKGLLIGFEIVKNQEEYFSPETKVSEKINQYAMELGAIFYPGSGTMDGINGDHLLIGPPLTISREEIDELTFILDQAITKFEKELI